MKKYTFLMLLCCFVHFSCTSQAQNETTEKIETYLDNIEQAGFLGSVLVAKGGEIILSKGYGFSNVKQKIKNRPSTIFDIGSVTKQFTAAGILKLEMQGKLSVNDKILKYFDDLPLDKQDITLHHLLTHSSGLLPAIGGDYEAITTDDFVKKATNQALLFPVGSSYEYSNVGYSLLTIIIEKISGKTYETFLYENLWQPAKMEQTGYTRPHFKNKVATGYQNDKVWGKPNEKKWDSNAPFLHLKGNGGILSSTEDMYKWHLALLSDKVLSEAAIKKYFTPYVQEGEGAPSYYSYGWAIYTTARNTTLAAHNGGNGIFFADFWRYLADNMVIIVMNNKSARYSESIASQIGAITFSPTFEPIYPGDDDGINEEKLDILVFAVVEALAKNKPKAWQTFIEIHAMKDFITMAPMETHIKYFAQFHEKLKGGKVQSVSFEGDELIIDVKSQGKVEKLILYIELTRNGVVKFTGMKME